MFSTLGVERELQLSVIEHTISIDNVKFEPIWISTTECRITPIGLPTISLWEKEGFEVTFTAKGWTKEEVCVNYEELHFTEIPPFEIINVTFIANGEKKQFSINPPIRKIKFNANYNPSITIAHEFTTNQTITIEVMDCLTKKGIPMTYDRDDNKKPILLTKKWYNSLIDDTLIVINIKDNSYFSDDIELLVEAPPYTYFRPKPTNITPVVSPEKGYFVKFKLDPLSPRMRDFSGTFKEEDGKEIPFKVIDGTATISFDNIYESNSTLKTKEGSIDLEHYYYNYENKPTIEFEFSEHCNFLEINNLDRTSNKSLVEITTTENWIGNAIISINKESIADQNFVKLHEKEFKEFEFKINNMANISVNKIREKIPLIDEYFISTRAKMITLDLIHIPFDNLEVFGQQIIQLQINREETIFKFVREYEYQECGAERIWEVEYLEDYFPESSNFLFKYCGKTFSPETILNNGNVSFKVPQPEYDEVKKNPFWELLYDGNNIRKEDVSIREISFTKQSNEIALLCIEKDDKFISIPTIGTTDNNGQPNVKVEINLILGDECEQMIETVAKIDTFNYSRIESHIGKRFNKLHNQKGKIGDLSITIPSRNQLLVTLPICLDEGGEYKLTVLSEWLLTSWNKTISHLDEFSEMKEYLYFLILRDGRNIFNEDLKNELFYSIEFLDRLDKKLKKNTTFLGDVINVDGKFTTERLEHATNWCDWFEVNIHLLNNAKLFSSLFIWNSKLLKLYTKNTTTKSSKILGKYQQYYDWKKSTEHDLEYVIIHERDGYIKKLRQLLSELSKIENQITRNPRWELQEIIKSFKEEKERQENIKRLEQEKQDEIERLEKDGRKDEDAGGDDDDDGVESGSNGGGTDGGNGTGGGNETDTTSGKTKTATQKSKEKLKKYLEDQAKKKTPTKSNIQKPKPSPKKTNNPKNEGRRSDLIKARRRLVSNLENARNNSPKKQISAADAALKGFDRKYPSVKEWIN
jgi:hypothetical protein